MLIMYIFSYVFSDKKTYRQVKIVKLLQQRHQDSKTKINCACISIFQIENNLRNTQQNLQQEIILSRKTGYQAFYVSLV